MSLIRFLSHVVPHFARGNKKSLDIEILQVLHCKKVHLFLSFKNVTFLVAAYNGLIKAAHIEI